MRAWTPNITQNAATPAMIILTSARMVRRLSTPPSLRESRIQAAMKVAQNPQTYPKAREAICVPPIAE